MKPLHECMKEAQIALDALVDTAGSITHLTRMLNETKAGFFTPQMVGGWIHRGRISKRGAVAVVVHPSFSNFSLRRLRPDVEDAVWDSLIQEIQETIAKAH